MRTAAARGSPSIRTRLLVQLTALAAVLAVGLHFAVRSVADRAAEATQDGILGAAAAAILDSVRGGDGGIMVELPHAAFAMLGEPAQDRVFYRILVAGETATGYDDLPVPAGPLGPEPVFYPTHQFGQPVRAAAVARVLPVEGRLVPVTVVVARTRDAQAAVAAEVATRAAALGGLFFLVAGVLGLVATRNALRPVEELVGAIGRRGPEDLRPVTHPAPRELLPLVAALNAFLQRLRRAGRRTEIFISEAAHHLRTPLAELRNRAELTLHASQDAQTRQALRALIRAADRASRTAGQLLDHAMVAVRADRPERRPTDPRAPVVEAVRALAPTAELRDMDIRLHAPPSLPTITADPVLLATAVRNLLDNAVKYAPEESAIEVAIAPRAGGGVAVIVEDRGPGIPPAELSRLGERFTRGSTAAGTVGSGLGLAIVHDVARAHGGVLRLEPRPGGGTRAVLEIGP